jgi:ABC-2 type transport system permease protein
LAEGDQANLLEIAVFDNAIENTQGMTIKSPLVLERIWVKPGKSSDTYITNKLPIRAGIDPYNKMIDRIPDDNLLVLEDITN